MHTAIVITAGFAVLGLCALAGWLLGGTHGIAIGALGFLPVWLIEAGINMFLGVRRAGYSVGTEAPIALLVFAVPAAAALIVSWKLR